jgi:hypothetical protein
VTVRNSSGEPKRTGSCRQDARTARHEAILAAITDGDADAAEGTFAAHFGHMMAVQRSALENRSADDIPIGSLSETHPPSKSSRPACPGTHRAARATDRHRAGSAGWCGPAVDPALFRLVAVQVLDAATT